MPYLKKVTINNNGYFYLFHTVREGDKFRKLSKYLGKDEPSGDELERLKQDFLAEIKNQPYDDDEKIKPNVVAILQDLQEKEDYLSRESMIKLAHELEIPGTDIFGVATFYSQFRLKPAGKYTISVCSGTACHVKNSDILLKYLEELLDIKPGETTKDNRFTLEQVNCIGACAKAPAVMINEEVFGELDKKKLKKVVDGLK